MWTWTRHAERESPIFELSYEVQIQSHTWTALFLEYFVTWKTRPLLLICYADLKLQEFFIFFTLIIDHFNQVYTIIF